MVIHKTMTLNIKKKLGYETYITRSACNRRAFMSWGMPVSFISRLWSKVDCKFCLQHKDN